ncbi:MAG TPA: PQQ-dependent dehydrogenase, methanol/ethanol family [Gemmatimonadales bacterium]
MTALRSRSLRAFLIGCATGAAIWLLSPLITGRQEPWDAAVYFYPGALFIAGLLPGAFSPGHPRAAALGVFAGQAAVLLAGVVMRPADGGLWPLGLILLAVYSLVALLGAALADVLALKRRGSRLAPAMLIALTGHAAPLGAQSRPPVPETGQWTMPGRDHAVTRFSPLTDITSANVPRLRPTWTFSTGVLGGHEGQPLVVGSTMFVVTPYPNVVYAFDLTQEGYPLRWKYRPRVSQLAVGMACCDLVNRGAFYVDGRLIYNLLDGHTVALDAATGRELWKTKVAEVGVGETTPMAPLVVRDRVIIGVAGGEYGVRGWAKGLDLATGRVVWTGYTAGSDAEMLADPQSFKPFYQESSGSSVESWPPDGWRHGGGPVWGWLSYDPDLDLIYYGTGNPAPYNAEQRPGDNRWTTSVLARRPGDGALRWAYQFTPSDNWDYDSTQEMILTELAVKGRMRRVLVHFDKNGFVYVLDRATGELLSAEKYVPVNWARHVDLATGRPVLDSTKLTGASRGNVTDICPTLEGGKNQQPAAWSPATRLFYVPTANMCMDYATTPAAYVAGTPYVGVTAPYKPGAGTHLGALIAWDAERGRKAWEIKEKYPVWSGALATGGNLVFYGTLDGWFKAADARSGKPRWKFKVGSGVVGNPIAFRGPDGKQYVAVYSGLGGDWSQLAGDVRSDDPDDVRPPAPYMKDLARYTSLGGMVWIFGL